VSPLSTEWQIDGKRGATQGTYGLRRLVAALVFCRHVTPDRSRHDISRAASTAVNLAKTAVSVQSDRTTPTTETRVRFSSAYKRICEVDDIGRIAAWLASDQANYIHGTSIFVDGGVTLYPGFEARR